MNIIKNYIQTKQCCLTEAINMKKLGEYIAKNPGKKILAKLSNGEMVYLDDLYKVFKGNSTMNKNVLNKTVDRFGSPWMFKSMSVPQRQLEIQATNPNYNSGVQKMKDAFKKIQDTNRKTIKFINAPETKSNLNNVERKRHGVDY